MITSFEDFQLQVEDISNDYYDDEFESNSQNDRSFEIMKRPDEDSEQESVSMTKSTSINENDANYDEDFENIDVFSGNGMDEKMYESNSSSSISTSDKSVSSSSKVKTMLFPNSHIEIERDFDESKISNQFSPKSNHNDNAESRKANVSKIAFKLMSDDNTFNSLSPQSEWKTAQKSPLNNEDRLFRKGAEKLISPSITIRDPTAKAFDHYSTVKPVDSATLNMIIHVNKTDRNNTTNNETLKKNTIDDRNVDVVLERLINEAAIRLLKQQEFHQKLTEVTLKVPVLIGGIAPEEVKSVDDDIEEVQNNIEIEKNHPEYANAVSRIKKMYSAKQYKLYSDLKENTKSHTADERLSKSVKSSTKQRNNTVNHETRISPKESGKSCVAEVSMPQEMLKSVSSDLKYKLSDEAFSKLCLSRPDLIDKCESYYQTFLQKLTGVCKEMLQDVQKPTSEDIAMNRVLVHHLMDSFVSSNVIAKIRREMSEAAYLHSQQSRR